MKKVLLAAVGTALALAGCSAEHGRVDPSNPYPDVAQGNVRETGMLTVEGVPSTGPYDKQNKKLPASGSMYSVYDEKGNFVTDSAVPTTSLAPGRYLIQLDNEEFKPTPFWVTVESGKTTVVDANNVRTTDGKTLNAD